MSTRGTVDPGEVEAFRREVTQWLDARAARRDPDSGRAWGQGSDEIGTMQSHPTVELELEDLRRGRIWRREVFDAGLGWLGGPLEHGGAGRSPVLDEVYREAEAAYDVPSQNVFHSAMSLVAPSILAHGSEELKSRYLRPMFRGDIVCCQLLSEPDFGSDLAGIASRAVRDGDHWIVSGQKVWSSYAHFAEAGQLLVRTDPGVGKHRGLSMFIVDMDSPGVTVRPLRQMTGDYHFNEIFLEDVRIPASNMVGSPGEGWAAVTTTLMSERHAVGNGATNPTTDPLVRLRQLIDWLAMGEDPGVRQSFVEVFIDAELLRYLNLRKGEDLAQGRPLGPEGSLAKLLLARQTARISDLVSALLGPAVIADSGEWGTFAWSQWIVGAPHRRIAGGTDEIQRNILAERVLGLSREPSVR